MAPNVRSVCSPNDSDEQEKVMVEQGFSTKAQDLQASGTPLRKFGGYLRRIEPHFENERMRVDLSFDQMVVHKSITPYPFPVGVLSIRYRPLPNSGGKASDRSGWGRLLTSAVELGYDDFADLTDKWVEFDSWEETFQRKDAEGNEIEGEEGQGKVLYWKVIQVAGGASSNGASAGADSGKSKDERILELLDGKTIGEFSQEAMQDNALRNDQGFWPSLTNGTLIADLVAAGKVTEDDQHRYHVVK